MQTDAILANAGDGTKMDGENMVWEQQVVISRAVLAGKADVAQKVFGLMWSHVIIVTTDGVQADGSFHFHGWVCHPCPPVPQNQPPRTIKTFPSEA